MLTSRQINEGLEKLSDDGRFEIFDLDDTGKSVPYIGWFWREVDFDNQIDIGYIPGRFAGFMVNNKWDYPERLLSSEQSSELREICEDLVQTEQFHLIEEKLNNLFDHMQELWRKVE